MFKAKQMEKYLREAIEEYETNIESGKSFYMDAPILMDIEEYYEKAGRDYDAERLMRFAERLHPDSEDVLVVKASRLKNQGKWAEAIEIVNRIPNQQNREVVLFWDELDIAEGRAEVPFERLKKKFSQELTVEDYDRFLDVGEILMDYGYYTKARLLLEKIPQDYVFRNRVEELLADIYLYYQDYDRSIEHAENLINAAPYDAISWAQLADIQQRAKRYSDSVNSCDYALAIDENNAHAMSIKIFALFALKLVDEGLALAKEYMRKMPDNYSIPMYVGEQLYEQADYKGAETHLQTALRNCPIENPDRNRILSDIAYVCSMKSNPAATLRATEAQSVGGTNVVDMYMQRAQVFLETERKDYAVDAIGDLSVVHNLEDKDYARMIQFLFQHELFQGLAANIWKRFARLKLSIEYAPMYAYIAYALRESKQYNLYLPVLHFVISISPDAVIQLFSPIYYTYNLTELEERAKREAEAEQHEY